MVSLNKSFLIGKLTADPDYRTTPTGEQVCSFHIAINEGTREKPIVTFVKIEAWRKTAETCGRYLRKGSGVMIEGRLRLDSWDDKQTGKRRQQLFVVAQSVQFMSRPRTEGEEDQDNAGSYQQPHYSGGVDPGSEYAQPPMPPLEDEQGEGITDDIPF